MRIIVKHKAVDFVSQLGRTLLIGIQAQNPRLSTVAERSVLSSPKPFPGVLIDAGPITLQHCASIVGAIIDDGH
ncbi:MAG TPA: hypothetical protein PLV25_04795, partial [Opitutales bacterium]|nr:hypothetical protein [Opitutales bacterium]